MYVLNRKNLRNFFPEHAKALRAILAATDRYTLCDLSVAADKRYRECYNRPPLSDLQLHAFNAVLETHGVEGWPLGVYDGVSYCNTGDMYAMTIASTPDGFRICSLESLATRWPER